MGSGQGPSLGSGAWDPALLILNPNHLSEAEGVHVGGSSLQEPQSGDPGRWFVILVCVYWTFPGGMDTSQTRPPVNIPLGFGGVLRPAGQPCSCGS